MPMPNRPASQRSTRAVGRWRAAAGMSCSVVLAACGSAPPPADPAPAQSAPHSAATPAAPARPGGALPAAHEDRLLAQDDHLLVVLPGRTSTWDTLARHWLGDPTRGWEIAALNGLETPRPAEPLLLPRRPVNPIGLDRLQLQTVTILCYHRIGSGSGRMGVGAEQFAQQMEWLAGNGFRVIRLAELAQQLSGQRALPPRSIVITFDDGYESVHRHAYPVLRRLGFPATLFLYTDFIGAGADALTWAQVREMAASGLIDFQAHSRTHANLTQRQPGETDTTYRQRLDAEVSGSREAIQRRLSGSEVRHFAYPFGDSNELLRDVLLRRRFDLGLSVQPGGNPAFAPPLLLRRTMIYGSHDLEAFKSRLQIERPLPSPRSR